MENGREVFDAVLQALELPERHSSFLTDLNTWIDVESHSIERAALGSEVAIISWLMMLWQTRWKFAMLQKFVTLD